MFIADCYLSVISAFPVSHDGDEQRRRGRVKEQQNKNTVERKTSGQQSSLPQTGNVNLRMHRLWDRDFFFLVKGVGQYVAYSEL